MTQTVAIARMEQPVVFVIDDDASVREAVEDLLRSVGSEWSHSRQRRNSFRASAPIHPVASCSMSDCRDRADWNSSVH